MAKKLLTSYTFTPGAANAGTLVVSGTYALEQFLLVTNVTTGATIYQFNSPAKGGAVSTGGGNTTLTLEYSTSGMSSSDRLQVFVDDGLNPQVTLANAQVEVTNDAGNPLPVSGTVAVSGTTAVSATALPLPSGAATATNQGTGNTSLASIDGKVPALVNGAVPVSAEALPLPTGAATSALQTAGNTSLASLDTDLGALADAAATTDTGSFSVISLIKRGLQNWTTLLGRVPALDTGAVPVLVKNGQLEIQNDTGNPIPVGTAAQLNVTGSASANNTDLISTACDTYRSIAVQITGTFVGTLSFQVSNDNTNWAAVVAKSAGDTAGSFINSTTTPQLVVATLNGYQYFRLRFTSYTSGTATANAYLSRDCIPLAQVQTASTNTVVASTTTSASVLYTVNSAATTNAATIKTAGTNLYGISVINTSASTKYVRFFNQTTAPTVGTSIPIMVVAVPATSSKEIQYVPAVRFGTGLAVAITGGAAATDSTAVAAGDVQLLVSYA
jgi:hypothetical protein